MSDAQPLVVVDNIEMGKIRWLWPDKGILLPEDFAYIVIGLPRSGTTLTCKIIKELGIEWLSREYESPEWKTDSVRHLEQAPPFVFDSMCELKYSVGESVKGMKWLLPLSTIQISFLQTVRTKVIFCLRDIDETGASTLKHFGGRRAWDSTTLAYVLQYDMFKLGYLIKPEDIMQVNYHELLKKPVEIVAGISQRLNIGNDERIAKAASIVDPAKNNHKGQSFIETAVNQVLNEGEKS